MSYLHMIQEEAREKARRAKARLAISDTLELRAQIADTAFFTDVISAWREIFADDDDMLLRLQYERER